MLVAAVAVAGRGRWPAAAVLISRGAFGVLLALGHLAAAACLPARAGQPVHRRAT
jgi:hypothetical protein